MIEDSIKERNGEWQHFVDFCLDEIGKIKDSEYRKEKIANIREAHRIYRQIEEKKNKYWANESKVVLPMLTITVDNVEPRLVAGLVGKTPYVQFEMAGITQKDQETLILEDWFNEELKHTVGLEKIASTVVHKALLEGTTYPIVGYDEDEVLRRDLVFDRVPVMDQAGMPVMQQDPQTGQPVPQMEEQVKINPETGEPVTEDKIDRVFMGGKITFADFNDVYVADDACNWEQSNVYRTVRKTYGDLMLMDGKPGYINLGSWLLNETQTDDVDIDDDSQSPSEAVDNAKKLANKTIELYECSVSYVFQGADEEDEDVEDWTPKRYVALITKDTKTLVRMIPLIDLNFRNEHLIKRVRLNSETGKAYGISEYEKLKAVQNGSSMMFNLAANIATLTIIPWFLYQDSSGMPGAMTLELGKGIKVDDVSGIKFPEFKQNPRSFFPYIEQLQSFWQKQGSIGDVQTGQVSDKNRDVTGTETMAAIQEGNIKHNYQAKSLKEDFGAILSTLYDQYYQKMPYDAKFMYNGQPTKIPRSSMRRGMKFQLTGSTDLSNKIIDMQKSEGMYQMLRQDPMVDPMVLLADIIKTHMPDAMPQSYVNPQINQVMGIFQQFPEVLEMVMQYPQQQQMQQENAQQQQMQAQLQMQQAQAQHSMQSRDAQAQQNMQIKAQKAQQDAQVKQQKASHDAQIKQQKAEQDAQIKHANAIQAAYLKQQQKQQSERDGANAG